LDKEKAKGFKGTHSNGFNMLVQAIDAKATATVSITETLTSNGQTVTVQNEFGGGVTTYDTNGNANVYLSPNGRPGYPFPPMPGIDGKPIPDPLNIIAGHELLGHGRLEMLGRAHGESEAIGVENVLRREQGLPERGPDY
jgi:hypothetical protein